MTSVNYRLLSQRKIVLDSLNGEACYSKVFNGGYNRRTRFIILNEPKLLVDVEMAKQWVEDLNKLGFPCSYLGYMARPEYDIRNEQHLFMLELKRYKYKDHLASALTLLRYLFEIGLQQIVKFYFEVKSKYKRISILDALKIANVKYGNGNGHTLHRDPKYCLYTKKELMGKLKKEDSYGIFETGGTQLHDKWASKELVSVSVNNTIQTIKRKMKETTKNVYVVGGDVSYANWLPNYKVCKKLEEADLVMFTGGEDVHPSLYGEPMGQRTYSDLNRDLYEKKIFEEARKLGIKMIGICRGAQFLCVMNGGKLVQHQENPTYIHDIETSYGTMKITSTHHQAAYPFNLYSWLYKVIGWTNNISSIHLDGNDKELDPKRECEIVYYNTNQTSCLGIQGHPEHVQYQEAYPQSMDTLLHIFKQFENDNL